MSKLSRSVRPLLLLCLIVAIPAWAASRVSLSLDPQASEVGFVAHTALFAAEGRFSSFELEGSVEPEDLSTARIVARVRTASVDSGIDLRDKHLVGEDFFDSARFPMAVLRSESTERDEAGRLRMRATLSLRGVERPVEFPLEISGKLGDGHLVASGSFVVNRRDFGINYESGVLLPRIDDEVEVFFRVKLRTRPEPPTVTTSS